MNELQKLILGLAFGENKQTASESYYEVGKDYNLMTVLGWYKGKLERITDKELVLKDASWVSESERFSEYAADSSNVKEEEPFPENTRMIVERTSLIGGFEIKSLIRKLK